MKSCPTCNRTFEDLMTFCLVDGSILSAPFDPKAEKTPIEMPPPATLYPPAITAEPATASAERPAATMILPTESAAKPASLNEVNQPAIKTIVAAPPEVVFQPRLSGGGDREPRQTIASPRVQPTSAGSSEKRTSLRFLVIGGLAAVSVSVAGIFWFLQHNRAAVTPPAPNAVSQPVKDSRGNSLPPTTSFAENVNGVAIDMVFVTGGTFEMGSPDSDPGRDQDEGPQSQVTVQSFHVSKYEITQAQYKAVTSTNPSSFKGDSLPVDSVSWSAAVDFCRKLSELTGHPYRLPTEAEWEYAAKAGSADSPAANVDAFGWYEANSAGHPHQVGEKQANRFGLYDMKGNLWEWCQSKYKAYPYSATDGREDVAGSDVRVLRGGSFESATRGCRATYRRRVTPQPRTTGFRIVLVGS
jgi:formylglycine-generating enzyme required for sulfatase activity